MRKASKPEVIVVNRAKPSPIQKVLASKSFKNTMAELKEWYEAGRLKGLAEGRRLERRALMLWARRNRFYTDIDKNEIRLWIAARSKRGKERK